jgi:hypothetical protein
MRGTRLFAAVSVLVAAGTAGWTNPAAAARAMPPLIVIPGLGMSALQVNVERDSGAHTSFQFLVPVMTPARFLPAPATSALDYATRSGLAPQDAGSVPEWLSLAVGDDGRATNMPGVTVKPVFNDESRRPLRGVIGRVLEIKAQASHQLESRLSESPES